MEKPTPIKRSKAFIQLSKDHHFGLLLVWKIRQDLAKVSPADKISKYVIEFFDDELEAHFKEEEDYLFSKLDAADPLREQAEGEHRAICNLIASIKRTTTDKALLQQFGDLLEAHIRFEERTLFNYMQEHMSAADQEQLLQHTNRRKN
ncbi:hemerythrin domain-containing protein [Chitinophaga sancti]|uniref:Hemerythrin HHE cation binding domain-containing protein n=1 Tax=Chitinophaga sancti TaxID=1004 RepID=A0A1K1R6U9_9BACT|nr:hemerythrin domain-containing protein [Chitinophaga sancti]WQD64155.1 hemerythrin domain-containing protein [Chitinophaga sancti]WQG90221.1 hemerythrin domain-containing protein [Chitinophaga sancti]SFW67871.1 Hemerythrin HHE cation binding domain-containing protein [Chitinophaga sancti]